MQKQINAYIDKLFSPYLCGFRKGFGTQHALTSLIENGNLPYIRMLMRALC